MISSNNTDETRGEHAALAWLDAAIASPAVEPYGATKRAVLFAVWSLINRSDLAWSGSLKQIAERSGAGRSSASKYLSEMEQDGLFEVDRPHRQPMRIRLMVGTGGKSCAHETGAKSLRVQQMGANDQSLGPADGRKEVLGSSRRAQRDLRVQQMDPSLGFKRKTEEKNKDKEGRTGIVRVDQTAAALAFASGASQVSASERAIVARACTSGGVDIERVGPEAIDAIGKCAKILGRVWPVGFSLNSRGDCTVHHLVRAIGVEIATEGGSVPSACSRIAKSAAEQSAACTRAFGRGWQTDPERFVPGIDKWLDQGRWRVSPENAVRGLGGSGGSWADEYARSPAGGA